MNLSQAYIDNNYPNLIGTLKERISDPAAKNFSQKQLEIVKDARDRHVMSQDAQKEFFKDVWNTMEVQGLLKNVPNAWINDAKQEVNDICEGKYRSNDIQLKR